MSPPPPKMASDHTTSQEPLSLVPPTLAPIDEASESGTATNQASSSDDAAKGAANTATKPSGAVRRAPRVRPAHLAPDLPATAAEVTDLASLSRVVKLLSDCIVKAVQAGNSVTAPNKRLIVFAAEETRRALAAIERRTDTQHMAPTAQSPAPLTEPLTLTTNPSTTEPSAPLTAPSASLPTSTLSEEATIGLKRELAACMREQFGKLKAELSHSVHRTAARVSSAPTYAQATRKQQPRSQQTTTPTVKSAPPTSRPAIIVAAKTEVSCRQETVQAFRRSISFRTSSYAPARVQPVSNSKLRVEFETAQQCDDALSRLTDAGEVTAERARALQPMLILKGISKTTPREELLDALRAQNDCADSDLTIKFIRDNKNEALYNAVLMANPEAWRKLVGLGRVCIDHQRVHAEKFSPFLQCFSCLQFGHVRNKCRPDTVKPCALCASTAHQEPDCPNKEGGGSPRCINCVQMNAKYNGSYRTDHKATSSSCPVLCAMRARVESRIDYGPAQ